MGSEAEQLIEQGKGIGMEKRGGVQLTRLDEALSFARWAVTAGAAPKGDTPATVLLKIQAGAELGISPTQAMSSVVFVNGRRSIMGDLSLALLRRGGAFKRGTDVEVEYEGEGDARVCTVSANKRGVRKTVSRSFSVADAKQMRLWGKPGPWSTSPDRMIYYRALGFLCRDYFSEVLAGFSLTEEVRDIQSMDEPPVRAVAAEVVSPAQLAAGGDDPLMASAPEAEELVEANVEPADGPSQPPDDPPVDPVPVADPDPECETCAGCGAVLEFQRDLDDDGSTLVTPFCGECGLVGPDTAHAPQDAYGEAQASQAPEDGEHLELKATPPLAKPSRAKKKTKRAQAGPTSHGMF